MNKNIRLLSILEELTTKKKVCKKVLKERWECSYKSIDNDFKVLEEYFEERLLKEKGCYSLLTKDNFSKLFENNLEITKAFLHLVWVVDTKLFNDFIEENSHLLKPLNLTSLQTYQITNNPYEELKQKNKKVLESLEKAIVSKQYLTIHYSLPHQKKERFSHVIPLKILYLGSNWYLALLIQSYSLEEETFKLFRINFISKIEPSTLEPLFFHSDNVEKIKADRFLKNIQSSFSKPNIKPYEVILKIHAQKARYFKYKIYLMSQKVTKEFETGELLVTYKVTNDMEIIPLIQRWMPYVEVIEPLEIKNKIAENFKEFMKGV